MKKRRAANFWSLSGDLTSAIILGVLALSAANLFLAAVVLQNSFGGPTPINYAVQAPLALSIKEPASGAVISGDSRVTVSFPLGYGFAKVKLSIDGVLEREVGPSPGPYEVTFSFDSQKFADGEHNLLVEAFDLAGETLTGSVKVQIENKAASR